MESSCVYSTQSCSLNAALAALQSDDTSGVPVVIHLAPGTYLLDNAPFVFNASTRASDILLVGAFGTTLQASSPNASLFKVVVGAPTVTLVSLQLNSQVLIDGGVLHVQNCTCKESSAELGGAVQVKGGSLAVERTVFEGCKATRGGAAWVSGGVAIFSRCTFKDCTASEETGAGAVWVEPSGSVVLRQETLLHDNYAAGLLNSIHVAVGGKLQYVLPAPLAHYIDLARDGVVAADYRGRSAIALTAGKQYQNYPSACAAGVYGNSYVTVEQSSGLCSALCPAGHVCGASATVTPVPCERGSYCREGSSAARPCPSGSFGNMTGLISADACHVCPVGSACGIGATAPVACTPGTFSDNSSSAACTVCPELTYQPSTGSTGCLDCGEGYHCPPGSSARIPASCNEGTYLPKGRAFADQGDCEQCPIGRWCVGGRSKPKMCGVGSFASIQGAVGCSDCEPGSFQEERGATRCKVCPIASYCSGGSSTPRECGLGSFASIQGAAGCSDCKPGFYQDERGTTRCKVCPIASYCSGDGASASKPCPGGTWSNRTGLVSKHECTKVVRGEWAPTGSAAAKHCPASGFYCPGYDTDSINDPPGSEPIIIDSGASRKTRKVPSSPLTTHHSPLTTHHSPLTTYCTHTPRSPPFTMAILTRCRLSPSGLRWRRSCPTTMRETR